ncbi:hypothetical protein J31TS4_31340 [Paenibacillus sp. J31TS4]|uniref:FIMAH domain-containing protein n=1 Tax=Paenibacillus sp. J31TS4 TaxID=2807195 RepID=UPI001B1644D4|nr:hypothetical protein [Paenibacillus sp. J31TS4]GIP39854.1 hypothetical protein J31TS4_31340 [Paenibacillus sp. J31TS4]
MIPFLKHGKKGLVLCLAFAISLGTAVMQPEQASARVDKTFSEPIEVGSPIESIAIYDAAFGKEDGRDVMYTTASGKPAIFQVIDLASKEVLRKFPLTGSESSWTHMTMPDGTVYIGGNGTLYSYSPVTKQVTTLGGIGESVVYGLSHDEQGRVYFGSYPNAKVGRYDPATRQMKDYGNVAPGDNYSRGTAYLNGYVYAGIGIKGSLSKINVETGAVERIALPTYGGAVQLSDVYQLNAAGKYIVAGLGGGNKALLFYDTETGKWADQYFLDNKGIQLSYGKPGSNKVYFVQNNRLMEVDLGTLTAVDTGVTFGTYLRHTAWVDVPNDPDLPGSSLATVMFGGTVAYMNLETKVTKTVTLPVSGNPIPIQALEKGPDGKLYMSGYPGGKGAAYSPETGAMQSFALSQVEGMGSLGNKLYMGAYTGAVIYELDVTQPIVDNKNPKVFYDIPHEDRPFMITSGEGKLFIGTIPDYGVLGGALTVYDPSSGTEPVVYPNVIDKQSIVGLAVHNGMLYGSTTVAGGLGIDPSEPAAKMFVWDIATNTKVREIVPTIPGVTVQPKMISGLSFGPDGLLWGTADGTIFAMNPQTLEVVKSKNIYPTVTDFGRWRPVYIRWGSDGLMYTTLAGKLTVIDPSDLDSVALATTSLMTLGNDGNIYYAADTKLMKVEVAKGSGELPIDIQVPIRNGSFDMGKEDGTIPGWSSMFAVTPNVSYGISSERYASAPSSLKITDAATTETVAVWSDPIPVVPGTEYTANAQLYLQSGRTLASFNFYDANGKQLDSASLQITTGAGKWQPLTMTKTAPAGAAYAKVVLFCSNLWTTTAFYDDVSVSYIAKFSPSGLLAEIEAAEQIGGLSHSVAMQLTNAVKQGIHHKEGGRQEQAVKHLGDALKHLERAKSSDASEAARSLISQILAAFIEEWS